MPLETNLNTPPYYDDFNANNNYHKILFRPSTAVQARELTQLQTILQDQVEKFGKHVFRDGSIIEGCTITLDSSYDYVKVLDNYANGVAFNIQDFIGKKAVGTNGLEAYIVNALQGLESDAPNLNTLYVRYLNSATYANTSPQKLFDPDESIEVRTTANVLFGTVTVANSVSNATGKGYAATISEGTIFQKGFFISVLPQTLVVAKYSNVPNNVSIGFKTLESIITSDTDGSLFDNAIGAPNYNAPGANRLKLTANLVVRDTSDAANTDAFFSIIDFEDGLPVQNRAMSQYAALGAEMARRTFEESGDYIIDPFEMYITSNTANTNSLTLEVDKGHGYVSGYRVEFLNKRRSSIRRGTDVAYYDNQIITANYGNYVYVDEAAGTLDLTNLDSLDLYDTVNDIVTKGSYSTATPAGNKIGTASSRTITYYSGTPGTPTAQYKLYLFNINMDSGKNFKDVRSVYAIDGSSRKFFADIVLDNGNAVLREPAGNQLVVNLGKKAVRNLRNAAAQNATEFTYRTQKDITFQANGVATFALDVPFSGGTETFTATGSLSEANEAKFIVVSRANANGANVNGTATIADGTANIVGLSTSFNTEFAAGDHIIFSNGTQSAVHQIVSVTNSTHMVVANTANNTTKIEVVGSGKIARYFPNGSIISLTREDSANVFIEANATSAAVRLNTALAGSITLPATVYYDVNRSNANPASKTVKKSRFVKIDASNNAGGTIGPWSLGLPDVYKIRNIYQGTTYANTNTNYASKFVLDSGQRDSHYGIASISIKPGTNHTVSASEKLLVELDHFEQDTTTGIGFFAVTSYQIDDANTANTTAITTQEIPVYTSPTTGIVLDLRDCIDFRPYMTATANSSNTIAGATINPSSNGVFTLPNGPYTATPDTNFVTHFSYYLGRKDKVALSPQGRIIDVEGTPSVSPQAPRDINGAMTLGVLTIPPYPSLSQTEARTYSRPDYGVGINLTQNRRYTMRDIGVVDKKVDRLEYYTSLSLLEASAKTLSLKDSSGLERYKNGFLVEPFKGFTIADTKSPEFKAAVDIKVQEMAPTVKRTYVELDFDSVNSNNVVQANNIITIDNTETPYITQEFASKIRNCVENIIYTFRGNLSLFPEGDTEPDIYTNPDIVASIDLSGLADFFNGLPNVLGTERVVTTEQIITRDTARLTVIGTNLASQREVDIQTISSTFRNEIDFSASTVENTYNFGQVVQDVAIQQFVRPRALGFVATGLRPGTTVYPFFDGVNVDAHCQSVSFVANSATVRINNITTLGGPAWEGVSDKSRLPAGNSNTYVSILDTKSGNGFVTSATGEVRGIFFIPEGRFKVGDRLFTLADVESLENESEAITTRAAATYTASNIGITKANVKLTTRIPQLAVTSVLALDSQTTQTSTQTTTTIIGPAPTTSPRPASDLAPTTTPTPTPVRNDPIAQTFYVGEPAGIPGIVISKLDVYFKTKDPTLGIEVQIREVDNGFPTPYIVPFGRKVLESSQCTVSNDASSATTFEFDSPVFLQSGKEYCFVLIPIGSSINWTVWVGEVGQTDITTNRPIYVNNSTGVLFTSSTDNVWTPYQKEDIKFTIHRKQFSHSTGTIKYYNSNTEFLSANNYKGTFLPGERIFVSNGVVTISDASFTTTSNTVNLKGMVANAQTAFTIGSYIYLTANDGAVTDLRTVSTLPNATHITVSSNLSFSDSNASIGYLYGNGALYGYVNRNSKPDNLLHLERSSATTATNFVAVYSSQLSNVMLIGEVSQARANLVSVDSITYSTVVPQFSYLTPAGTTASINMAGFSDSLGAVETTTTRTTVDMETFFSDKERKVLSRSTELSVYSGAKSLQVTVPVTTEIGKVSPMFDDIKSNMVVIQNLISDSTSISGESSSIGGNTQAKYISKRVVLAEGQDAEDLIIYLSAYKPSGTDIKVYCKLLNSEDPETIDQKTWSLLDQRTSSAVVSSRVYRDDYREYEYRLPSNTASLVSTSAFLNSNNSGIVRYRNNANSIFDGYKTFAIKLVLVSDEGSHLVPRVSDMRAIALQV